MMSVKFSITPDDYAAYYQYFMWDAPERRKARFKYYLRQVLINGCIVLILLYTQSFRYNNYMLYLYVGILTLVTILQLVSGKATVRRQAEKVISDPANSAFFKEVSYEFSETGITRKDEFTESKYQWPAIVRKEETKEFYFLMTSSTNGMILPRRVFKTTDEKMLFEKMLSKYISFDAEVGHLVKD